MANRDVNLTDEQKERNNQILARLQDEQKRLIEETRALQAQYRRQVRSQRAHGHADGLEDGIE
jgi:hypothetical protein